MIAMALACKPKLLIADEPTTALDVTIQAQILELIKQLQQEEGMSVLFITHDMGVVAEIADRTVVMYNGDEIETGATEDIFANPQKPYTKSLLSAVPRLGSMIGRFASDFQVLFSTASIVAAFACSTLIGVAFGFLPARNAAQLDPVEALARE